MYTIEAADENEQRKRLTPDVRNDSLRPSFNHMYAHMSQPNEDFCTRVAMQLVQKYSVALSDCSAGFGVVDGLRAVD